MGFLLSALFTVWPRSSCWTPGTFNWSGEVFWPAPAPCTVRPSSTIHWRGATDDAFSSGRCLCPGCPQQPNRQFHCHHTSRRDGGTANKQHTCPSIEGDPEQPVGFTVWSNSHSKQISLWFPLWRVWYASLENSETVNAVVAFIAILMYEFRAIVMIVHFIN